MGRGFSISGTWSTPAATYDLPIGKGRRFLNYGGVVNGVFGGWTLGTILAIQSGSPSQIGNVTNPASDGYNTVNGNEAGVYFNGITARQLQSAVGVYHTGNPWVLTLNPNLIAPSGIAASSLAPHPPPVPIRERLRATFRAEFLNVTNHPTFNLGTLSAFHVVWAADSHRPIGGAADRVAGEY